MSANAEENHRNGRRGNDSNRGANQNQNQNPNQQAQAQAQPQPPQRQPTGSRDGTPHGSLSRRGGGKAGVPNPRSNTDNTTNSATGRSTQQQQTGLASDHTPMAGFNAAAVENMLKQGYDAKAPVYKPDTAKAPAAKPDAPWGAKPGTMANGKDFFVELRKQVAALEQSGGVSQGG